ncbi:MAG: TonB-dependent receptor [Bacteroidetes bacterium]|nr:TonB-dependent receptor [Bacteroidota bacterium]
MRNIWLVVFFFLFGKAVFSQEKASTCDPRISGYIKDSASQYGLERATLHLKKPGSAFNHSTVSDNTGYFVFDHLQPGKYELSIDFVGYKSVIKSYTIAGTDDSFLQDIIYMIPASSILQNVVVTASKAIVENKIDKLVYNVDKDVTSQGGTATDVLRKVPQVTVDVNGNVELLGNPSVRFLINGKTSTMFGNSISDALQSIPASQIQSIEVLSSPGAKYDASGTGGIINIVLKKNRAQGFSGVVNVTTGTRLENGSLNLNYKKNNISFSGYFNGSSQLKVNTLSELTRNSVDTASGNLYYLHQQGNSDFTRNSFRSGFGIDWDITPKDNFSFSAGYDHFGNSNNGITNQYNNEKDKFSNLLDELYSNRSSNTKFNNGNLDLSVDYKKKFNKEKQELTFSFIHSEGNNNTYYLQSQQYQINDSIFSGSTSKNPGKDKLTSFGIDYSTPLTKNFIAETGVKLEAEDLLSDANVLTFSPQVYEYVYDSKQSYTSSFKRKVYAAYLSGTFNLFKVLNVIAGARLEHTTNNAWYSNSGKANIPDYNNLAPSITVAHTFSNQQLIKFGYTYRLERPEFRDLNPFVNLSDPHNIFTGNPNIKPELGHDYQLAYSQNFGKDNSINIILIYIYNSPDIKSYTTFYPEYIVGDSTYSNVNVTRRSNIANEHRYGLNLSGSFSIGKLNIRPNIQLYDRQVNNIYAIPPKSGGFESRGNMNMNYQVNKTLVAEAFGNYRSGLKWQGRQAGFYSYSVALRQQLFKGKGSLGIVAVNAFGKYLTQKTTQDAVGLNATTILHIPYRSVGISFMYKFGKLKIKANEAENLLTKPPVDSQ